jgi:hypothetical protein
MSSVSVTMHQIACACKQSNDSRFKPSSDALVAYSDRNTGHARVVTGMEISDRKTETYQNHHMKCMRVE